MKNISKKILLSLAILAISLVLINPVFARQVEGTNPSRPSSSGSNSGSSNSSSQDSSSGSSSFFGLVPWYHGAEFFIDGSTPTETELKTGIWVVVANVATDISIIAAYLIIGYVIYGGYLYVFSHGEPGKVAEGKKTLTQAFIGLGIVMLASTIMNTLRIALHGGGALKKQCTQRVCVAPGTMVEEFIKWVIGIAGVMSLIFIVYGGIMYITSTGDPGRVKKAKDMIMYSLIGLVIVGLSFAITAFVSNTIRNANTSAFINNMVISKEVYEIKNS